MAAARAPDFASLWVDDDPAWKRATAPACRCCATLRSGRELDWPFDAAAVEALVAGANAG